MCILRKVCWDIRNFIDEAKPLKSRVDVSIHENMLILMIFGLGRIRYQKHDEGCLVVWRTPKPLPIPPIARTVPKNFSLYRSPLIIGRFPPFPTPPSTTVSESDSSKLLEGIDFVDAVWRDLKMVLGLQSTMRSFEFSINYTYFACDVRIDEVADRFFELFEKNNKTLKVERVFVKILKEEQLLRILRFLNPRQLTIRSVRPLLKTRIDAEKLTEFDFWSNLESFDLKCFVLGNANIRKFLHIPKAEIHVENATSEDVRIIKETLMISPKLKSFKIEYETFLDISKLSEKIGKPDKEGEWSFDIPGSTEKLSINLNPMYRHGIHISKLSKL